MGTLPFWWILSWVVFAGGLLAATALLGGRRRDVAVAGWGALFGALAYPLGFREEGWYWAIPAGALLGWLFTAGWDFLREIAWPRLAPIIAPGHWDLATTRPPVGARQRRDRWSVTLSAAAGAAGIGLMVVCGFDASCRSEVVGPDLAGYLVLSAVLAWLGARFLDPVRDVVLPDTERRPAPGPPGEDTPTGGRAAAIGLTRGQIGILSLVGLLLLHVGGDFIGKGLQAQGGAGPFVLLINSLVAGVVTYYWAAAAVLRAPSVARRAAYTTTAIGGLIAAPFALVVGLRAMAAITFSGTSPQAQALVALLIGALIFLGIAILFGLVLFGLYAYAGGLALDRLRLTPLAWRIAIGVFAVAIVQTMLQLLVMASLKSTLAAAGQPPVELTAGDWLVHVAMAAGWVLGLWVDPATERTLSTAPS